MKCFDKNAEELKKDSDLLMKMLGKQVEAFNSDEVKRREAFESEWKQINERWVKAQNEKELQAQKELLSQKDEQIINQQEQLSQKDEELLNQQEKIVSLVKLLKSLGKTTLEIKEATGLTTDEIEKM
ncbi:unknown [Clostridium sp. CAG:307]|nr:unknown [Clostridium sp. CAG:307]